MADPQITYANDLAKVQSIDFVKRFNESAVQLATLLGITRKLPLSQEVSLKIYNWKKVTLAQQVEEGEVIPLTKVEREVKLQPTAKLRKYRKQVTAESIIRTGSQDLAINQTDLRVVREIQLDIKQTLRNYLDLAPEKLEVNSLQDGIAQAWAKTKDIFKEYGDVQVIHFVSPFDVADYLGSGVVSNTTNSGFGLTALENFLGQRVIVFDEVPKGTIYSTVAENIVMAYYTMSGSPISQSFGLTTDETGLIGMTHQQNADNASIDTLIMTGLTLFAEVANGVVKTTIKKEEPKPNPKP